MELISFTNSQAAWRAISFSLYLWPLLIWSYRMCFPGRHMFLYFSFPSLLYMSGQCGKSLSLRASCPDVCKHNSLWWTMCLENSRGEQTKALFHARLSLSPSLSALLTCRWGFIPCLFAQSACGGAYATDFQEIAHCLLLTVVWMLFRAASFLTIGVKIA